MLRYYLPITLSILCFASSAAAELFRCNGVWTNKRCEGEAHARLDETVATPEQAARKTKYAAADSLLKYVTRSHLSGSMYGLAYSTQKYCRQEAVSVSDCERRIGEAYKYYEPRVNEARAAARRAYERAKREKEKALIAERRHQENLREMQSLRDEVRGVRNTLLYDW